VKAPALPTHLFAHAHRFSIIFFASFPDNYIRNFGLRRVMSINKQGRAARALLLAVTFAALALSNGACAAASRAPEAGRPRGPEAPYPVVLGASEERRELALATWTALARDAGETSPPAPELQPVTATLATLPSALTAPLRLPRVGGVDGKEPTEEETREALRRFIAGAAPLLGVVRSELSLVERTDNPDGTKRALYQQNPFDLPLRGGYGVLEITYTPDRHIVGLKSTAIPDSERLRRALTTVRQQQTLTAERATQSLAGRVVSVKDGAGNVGAYTFTPSDRLTAGELVVHPVRPPADPSVIELRLAWEVRVERAGARPLIVYVDAVSGEPFAADLAPQKT
jgi:hypothetical protein